MFWPSKVKPYNAHTGTQRRFDLRYQDSSVPQHSHVSIPAFQACDPGQHRLLNLARSLRARRQCPNMPNPQYPHIVAGRIGSAVRVERNICFSIRNLIPGGRL